MRTEEKLLPRALRGAVDTDLASDEQQDRWLRDNLPVWTGHAVKDRVAKLLGGRTRSA